MGIIDSLLASFRRLGVLLFVGLILIVYIAVAFVYWQQDGKQREFNTQIAKAEAIVARPLPSVTALKAESDNVMHALTPISNEEAIKRLIIIGEQNGIDVDSADGKFIVPPASSGQITVAEGIFEVLSFRNIHVQGDYDKVMAFLADLDSGKTLPNMELVKVSTREVEIGPGSKEGERLAEYLTVAAAVKAMMADNGLTQIPNPLSYLGSVAVNKMGDDPGVGKVEGFPDIDTLPAEKGYTGTGSPRGGYVLYQHDKIDPVDTTQFTTINYLDTLTTVYYYTCEADGTVRQFDGPDVFNAREYLNTQVSNVELAATVDVDIYLKK